MPRGGLRAAARPTGDRPARPALARARLWRRHHGQGAGRDRRAARAAHSGRIAPALRRELPPAARARLHRAAAAGFLEIRRQKTEPRGTETTTVPRCGAWRRHAGVLVRPLAPLCLVSVSETLGKTINGLDNPDSRRNLHRPRDQRLSAGRVLITPQLLRS